MDFRPSLDQTTINLAQPLRDALIGTPRAAFAAAGDHAHRLRLLLGGRKFQLLKQDSERQRAFLPTDVLGLINELRYHRQLKALSFEVQENLIWQVLSEAVAQIHHKLIYDINKRRYRIAEPLVQALPGQPGDFLREYNLRFAFENEKDKAAFERTFPSPNLPPQLELPLAGSRHIYAPLYRGGKDKGVDGPKLKTIAISPDAPNPGERKFIEDLSGFLAEPTWRPRLSDYSFYLMRNVESLRSVGVYLNTETRAYFPDFILWAVGSTRTHIILVDPKGQSGIMDWNTLNAGYNAKVALAGSRDLVQLGRELTIQTKIQFKISFFILLRKSSPLGKAIGTHYDQNMVDQIQSRHVLHLDWAPIINGNRINEDGDHLAEPPNGRCYLERMLTLAGILEER